MATSTSRVCISDRCGTVFTPNEKPNGFAYCGKCLDKFQEAIKARKDSQKPKRQGNVTTFAEPANSPHPIDCPRTVLVGGRTLCGICGSDSFDKDYGHCPYGCGTYSTCEGCKSILDFIEDRGY